MQTKRILSKVAIVLLIAVFSIAGIISCAGADDITGSRGGLIEEPTNPGAPVDPSDPENPEEPNDNNGDTGDRLNVEETKGKTFYGSSYRGVYIFGVSEPWTRVSYNDTDRMDRIWKNMIDRGIRDGKRRMYIKSDDGDFFFDENYNIRWSKKPDTVLKWFQGGVIAQLRQGYGNNVHSASEYGSTWSGSWTIGGLYTFAMHLSEANRFNSTRVNEFFWDNSSLKGRWSRFGGRMEVLVVHPGYPVDLGTGLFKVVKWDTTGWTGTAYALQSYTASKDTGYDDGNHYIWNIKGNTPERYMPHLDKTHQLYHLSFRWAFDKTYDPNTFSEVSSSEGENRLSSTRVNLKDYQF